MIRIQATAALGLTALTLAACGLTNGSNTGPTRYSVESSATTPIADPTSVVTPTTTVAAGKTSEGVLQGGGKTPAQLDTTTSAEKAAAAAPSTGGGKLGMTTASLGDATESGFWIKTPLVKAPGKGRVVNPANGKSANVDLIPLSGDGAGSQLSLASMQALKIPLTDLPDVEVWQN
ncbi:MAG: hypothetical protein ACK5LJ_16550 [Paracoccus sp. (in: a-proteobacteria)]